jgi:hypothetical protein
MRNEESEKPSEFLTVQSMEIETIKKIWTKSTHWRIVRGCGQNFARIASATARAQRWLCLDTSWIIQPQSDRAQQQH